MNNKKKNPNQFPLQKMRNCRKNKKIHSVPKCLAAQRKCKQSITGENDYKATRTVKAGE